MGKPSTHKKQHWVAHGYLKAWHDPTAQPPEGPYVWVGNKSTREMRRKSPAKIFRTTDFYTIARPDGSRDLELERLLNDLETAFCGVRAVIERREPLTPEHRAHLLLFMSAAQRRTRSEEEHWQQEFGGVLQKMEGMKEAVEAMPPEKRLELGKMNSARGQDSDRLSMSDVKELARKPLLRGLRPMVAAECRMLSRMNLTIFCLEHEIGFLTSDRPCLMFDATARSSFYVGPYDSQTVEITMPISPRHLALISWAEEDEYVDADVEIMAMMNCRTIRFCAESFVVRRNMFDPGWFDGACKPFIKVETDD